MSLTYNDPTMSHDEAVTLLASNIEKNVIAALLSIGINETDRVWAQNTCLSHLDSNSESVAASAVTALGHIARRFGNVDDWVFQALSTVEAKYPNLEGIVADTLDDIETFT